MEGTKTLQKIIEKIIKNPEEKKYRKIKRNSKYIKKRLNGQDIKVLYEIGFQDQTHNDHGKLMVLEEGYDEQILKYVEGCLGQAMSRKVPYEPNELKNQIRAYKQNELSMDDYDGFVVIDKNKKNEEENKWEEKATKAKKITKEQMKAFKQEFEENEVERRITGETGYRLLKKSELESRILATIWTLCDRGDKGYLEKWEFYLAKYLISAIKEGSPLPNEEEMRVLFKKYENEKDEEKEEEKEEEETKEEQKTKKVLQYTKMQLENMEADATCAICYDIYENPYKLPCNHSYCKGCIDEISEYYKTDKLTCPKCKAEVSKESPKPDADMVKLVKRVTEILDHVNHLEQTQGKQMITYSSLGNSQGNYTEMQRSTSNISLELVNGPSNTQPPSLTGAFTKTIDYIPFGQVFILTQSDSLKKGVTNAEHIQNQTKCQLKVPYQPTTTDGDECVITIVANDQQQLHIAEAMIFDCISTFNSSGQQQQQMRHVNNHHNNTHNNTYDVYRRMIDDVPKCYHEDLNKKGRQSLNQIEHATGTKIKFIPEMGTLEISGNTETSVADAGRMIHIIYENIQATLEKSTSSAHLSLQPSFHPYPQQPRPNSMPRMHQSMMQTQLPPHFEMKLDPRTNRHYFIDHLHEFTTWYHPETQKYKEQLNKHLADKQAHHHHHTMASSTHASSSSSSSSRPSQDCIIM